MGDCRYCGEPAGFLRRQHGSCAKKNSRATAAIRDLCVQAALRGDDLEALPARIRETAAAGFIDMSDAALRDTLADTWGDAVEAAMQDHVLTGDERRGLSRYRDQFGLSPSRLDRRGHYDLFRKLALLNAIGEHGVIPRYDRRTARAEFGRLPFNLMKSEALIWLFDDVGYLRQVTRREFRGQSMGVSVRVAKGVYVRPGAFRGRPIEKTEMERTDHGILAVTTKHIYFKGGDKSFRVRLERIVSFEPYTDGLGIMRDTARAVPEAFTMEGLDAWLAINLIDAVLDLEDVTLPKRDSPTLDDIVDAGSDDDAGLFIAGAGASR
jgi:hypothetical protein